MPDGDTSTPRSTAARSSTETSGPTVRCPECRQPIPSNVLETHLRQAHQLYLFRGVRLSLNAAVSALLEALFTERPDPQAWRMLAAIAHEEHAGKAGQFLTGLLGPALARLSDFYRGVAIEGLAPVIAPSASTQMVTALASDAELCARHLALAVLGKMPLPLDPALFQPLPGLLLDRRLPVPDQLAAMAAVVGTAGGDSPITHELLQKMVSGLGKARSIERLHELEQRTGKIQAIDDLCTELEDRLRMSCPRCSVSLRRPQMVEHLWKEHRLVLDGRRVRDPWSLVEEWLDAYREGNNPAMLDRCRIVSYRIDPEQGPPRLLRLVLAHGVNDPAAHDYLIQEARYYHASRCPHCYALVLVPPETPPFAINERAGRLSARGYSVEVTEKKLLTSMEVRTPTELIRRGRESHQWLTIRGASVLLVTPILLLALAAAVGLIDWMEPPLWWVVSLVVAAIIAAFLVRSSWRAKTPQKQRIRKYAWTVLAPRLHAGGFVPQDSAFLAGLALHSRGDRGGAWRGRLLPDLVKQTEAAVSSGIVPPGHLAALVRLQVEDTAVAGGDPVPLALAPLARCFQGRLPLAFAEDLLDDWRADWWTRGTRARLRILLCDRAFEAGFEVQNLLDAGQTAPALGMLLRCDQPEGLSALRLLWSLRAGQPWFRCGEVSTAFQLAADASRTRLLGQYPDLILWQEERGWSIGAGAKGKMLPLEVIFCVRGVVIQDVLFEAALDKVEVAWKHPAAELTLGKERFRSNTDMDSLARHVERWFKYAFGDFLPQLPEVAAWQTPDRAAILRAWGAVACPDCGHPLLPRLGEVGLALEEEATEAQ
jgi:hypothetical protein